MWDFHPPVALKLTTQPHKKAQEVKTETEFAFNKKFTKQSRGHCGRRRKEKRQGHQTQRMTL